VVIFENLTNCTTQSRWEIFYNIKFTLLHIQWEGQSK